MGRGMYALPSRPNKIVANARIGMLILDFLGCFLTQFDSFYTKRKHVIQRR
jgi:hypothetical protein